MTRLLAADSEGIAEAARRLRAGQLVAFPTETVYGLGADATDSTASARIYAAKGRPSFNPLIAHLADLKAARREGVFSDVALRLAHAFWPGPLTLVVPVAATATVSELSRAGLESVGLRVPSHLIALALLKAVDRPVAAPSANRSGHVSPTTATHVLNDLDGQIDAILDGGACEVGIESTIVGCIGDEAVLLRPGMITRAALESAAGRPVLVPDDNDRHAPRSPGRLDAHYAPKTPVRWLGKGPVLPGSAVLAFGNNLPIDVNAARVVQNLSPIGNLVEAAANLYSALRSLDTVGAEVILVTDIPNDGLGEAILDRLKRAAAAATVEQ